MSYLWDWLKLTARMEKHERNRAWYTPQECLEKIGQWYSDPSGSGELQGLKEEKKAGKKQRKGGAMERAIRAFSESQGLDQRT